MCVDRYSLLNLLDYLSLLSFLFGICMERGQGFFLFFIIDRNLLLRPYLTNQLKPQIHTRTTIINEPFKSKVH